MSGALANFAEQAGWCRKLGSPFTAMVCELLPGLLDRTSAFGRRVLDWPAERARADALALRCCGALHHLARSGAVPQLTALYPPRPVAASDDLRRAIVQAIALADDTMTAMLDSAPQTNEVGRSGVLLGGFLRVAAATGLPLDLYELGASAGLNLLFDHYAYDLGEGRRRGPPDARVTIACAWSGPAPDHALPLTVAGRQGVDLAPVRAADVRDRARLLAYVWPDQRLRHARITGALDIARDAGLTVARGDAVPFLREHLPPRGQRGVARVLYHSLFWQYLPAATIRALRARIDACLAAATDDAPFAWLRMEADGDGDSAGVRLTLAPGGEDRLIARADFHGAWTKFV